MIVKTNEEEASSSSSGKAALAVEECRAELFPIDDPPPYSAGPGPASSAAGPSRAGAPTSSSSASTFHPAPPPVQRSNFISIDRRDSGIKANYILDPTVDIPESLLPPLPLGIDPAAIIPEALRILGLGKSDKTIVKPRTRKNLSLRAQFGGIETEVTIPQVDPEVLQGKKMTMCIKCVHGNVKCRIRRPTTYPPFDLELTSEYGQIKLILPRTFHGPLTAKQTYGSAHLSDGITSKYTLYSEADGEKKCFIGDATDYLESVRRGTVWTGDEVVISANHGKLRILYEDEFEMERKGFLGGLMSAWLP